MIIRCDPFGGAVAAKPLSSSGFFGRAAQFWLLFATAWDNQTDAAANFAWSKAIFLAMLPFTSPYCYTGFPMLDIPNYLLSYYGSLLPSLQATKQRYDPDNFFQFPQSIPT
jgi:FAD/FMN-containing dehydrogenase